MSSFLSKKYLKYVRQAATAPPRPIDDDVACHGCGYNLRGLMTGQRCPECGALSDADGLLLDDDEAAANRRRGRPLIDLLGAGSAATRHRWQRGLTIAVVCIIVAMVARMGYSISGTVVQSASLDRIYVGGLLVASVAWNFALFKMLTSNIDVYWPWLRSARRMVLMSQPLWILGNLLWFIETLLSSGGLYLPALLIRFVAGIGIIPMLLILRQIAADAELNTCERRLNAAMVFLPIMTVIAYVLASVFTVSLSGLGRDPFSLLIALFLLPHLLGLALWFLALGVVALAFWSMREHARWSSYDIHQKATRPERVRAKRAVIERDVAKQVRSLPSTDASEISIDDRP